MKNRIPRYPVEYTPMLEWADKVVSKTIAERRVGSSPTWSTKGHSYYSKSCFMSLAKIYERVLLLHF